MQIRKAEPDDIGDIVRLLSQKRARLAQYEPAMWRRAPQAEKLSEVFLGHLLKQQTTLAFVAIEDNAVHGIVVALLQAAPPVYDPGGTTCFIDDFAVEDSAAGSRAAPLLLRQVWDEARRNGAVQTLLAAAEKDSRTSELLQSEGLRPASVWWTKSL